MEIESQRNRLKAEFFLGPSYGKCSKYGSELDCRGGCRLFPMAAGPFYWFCLSTPGCSQEPQFQQSLLMFGDCFIALLINS